MSIFRQATSRMRCLKTMRVLQEYLDGHLDEVSSRRVALHLEECRRCGLEASVYSEIKAALRRKERPVDPDTLDRLRRFGEALAVGNATPGEIRENGV